MVNDCEPGREELPELIFRLDTRLLVALAERLAVHGYQRVQYVPTRQSWSAVTTEFRNVVNLVRPRAHVVLTASIFPQLYWWMLMLRSKALHTCLRACFLNQWMPEHEVRGCFGDDLINDALEGRLVSRRGERLRFNMSIVPFENLLLCRDRHDTYPPYVNGSETFEGRVWMGNDSIAFASFLSEYLRGKKFEAAMEVGSGTGIQLLIASRHAEHCVAIDYNKRAVRLTEVNAILNGIDSCESFYSDLYENVSGQFDLILANPWYCDLESGGLEEVPGLVDGLNKHLKKNGLCLMILNSYVKNGKNMLLSFLQDFVARERYDADLYTLRYGLETDRIEDWKKNGVTHTVFYNVVLKKGGTGAMRVHDAPFVRKLGNFAQIYLFRALHRL